MITAKQIRELLQAKPFRPFRIGLSDGTHYDITNHDMAWVMKNTVEIGLNLDPDGFAEYAARCSILAHYQARGPPRIGFPLILEAQGSAHGDTNR